MPAAPQDEYGTTAACYDLLVEPLVRRIRRRVTELIAAGRYRLVLDCCCGTGRQARLLAAAPGRRVIGIDRSPAMLAQAGRNRSGGLDWVRADARFLGLRSAAFDAAVVSFALHEKSAPSAARMLDELRRVLRPGGRLLVVDFAPPHHVWSRIAHRFIARIERAAGRRHYRHYLAFIAAGGLAPLLTAARFRVSSCRHWFADAVVVVEAESELRRQF
ncbi:MAG: hypothetical protein AUK55_02885 [Syntrophobacteraceae bacterium CG2_30_61_12]|nr:MAG: hypothetical protein AUK55_02885 [Syntrophobacteraceae bacterium CG2_30_61_12]